jgi:hypothetical protein
MQQTEKAGKLPEPDSPLILAPMVIYANPQENYLGPERGETSGFQLINPNAWIWALNPLLNR